ncbi:MAG: hypothetical protein P8Q36_10840 [Alphaproteobacteria bacterium]|nr:hypothetical protein [Rhodospirillaceae bacterium]MBT6204724.1 hypothetical protein [Rhodospirillaceae bacterium]MBT6510815.1 hypothetical protein [Rhodospirillaceae bacterium]MBT7615453.1 hypothetical protein [Rhodospirillaceae bacterium]MDG2481345.1 hypothetical protein [Alphaproteobacteria bacterium]
MTGSGFLGALGWALVMTVVMTAALIIAKRVTPRTLRARWIAFALVDLLAVTMMIAAGLGCFVWPGELGLEGDLNLPFAIIVVSGLPWTPLALFSLVVMPLREMRGDVGQSPLGAGITAARQPARDC